MDEYTFILLAKLKADRLSLEREQRAALRAEHPRDEEPIARHRHSQRSPGFAAASGSREQS